MFIYTCSRSVSCLSSLPENATPIPWLRQRLPVEQLIPPWLEARPRSHPSKGQLNPLFYRWLQRHQTLPEVDKKKGSSALEKAVSSATSYCACFPIMWRYDMVIKICLVLVFFMHITWVILEQSCLPMTEYPCHVYKHVLAPYKNPTGSHYQRWMHLAVLVFELNHLKFSLCFYITYVAIIWWSASIRKILNLMWRHVVTLIVT